MTREELKKIYGRLTDGEKKAWAAAAGYRSYQGLYKHLTEGKRTTPYKVIEALISTIGQERLNRLNNEIRGNGEIINSLEGQKNTLIRDILVTRDKDLLLKIRQEVSTACDNQLVRLEIEDFVQP